MLSMDDPLMPAAYASQFSKAQYSAPPLSWPLVRRTIEREFGQPVEALFDDFTPQAAHGASIGQVHRASLRGQALAVKVQYPGVAESLTSDLRVVKPVALQMLGLREVDVAHYFKEVEARLKEETDYRMELRRSQELAAACTGLPDVRFPAFYPDRCSDRVLKKPPPDAGSPRPGGIHLSESRLLRSLQSAAPPAGTSQDTEVGTQRSSGPPQVTIFGGLGKCCGFCLWLTRRMARPPFLGKCGLAPGRERQNPRHIGEKTQSGGR